MGSRGFAGMVRWYGWRALGGAMNLLDRRLRLVAVIVLFAGAGGGVFLACGAVSESPSEEACDAGACDGRASSEDGSRSGPDAADSAIRDSGSDARVLKNCDDGGTPGQLDPTFGDGGVVYVDTDPLRGGVNAVVIQPDGKTVLGGYLSGRLALVRLTVPGTLDTTFGDGGIITVSFSTGNQGAQAVALAADGRILAAGYVDVPDAGTDWVAARFTPGGALDPTFGDGGVTFASFPQPDKGFVASVAVLPDGHVLVAGDRGKASLPATLETGDWAVVKFKPDGSLEPAFGSSGRVKLDIRSSYDILGAMAVQPDGKIVLVGSSGRDAGAGPEDVSAARINPDGSLDPSFGAGGKFWAGLTTPSHAHAVAPDGAGRIILGGYAYAVWADLDFALFRLTSAGAVDATFGSGGTVRVDVDGESDTVGGLFIQPDGKYVTAGTSSSPSNPTALLRVRSDGTLDPEFGVAGRVLGTPVSGFKSVHPRGFAFSRDRATVGGWWYREPPFPLYWMGVARYCL